MITRKELIDLSSAIIWITVEGRKRELNYQPELESLQKIFIYLDKTLKQQQEEN